MLRDNPEIAVRMMRKLSRRLRETDRLLRDALGMHGLGVAGEPPSAAPAEPRPRPDPRRRERLVHDDSGMEFRARRRGRRPRSAAAIR